MRNTLEVPVIGVLKTPFETIENMPIQSVGAQDIEGVAVINDEYGEGLQDLDGFSHMYLIYQFHKVSTKELRVIPFMDDKPHGIFATRSPKRPSGMGMSLVNIIKIAGNKVHFKGADMLNNTPLIDIKPFFCQSDNRPDAISGWLDEKDDDLVCKIKSDNRFA